MKNLNLNIQSSIKSLIVSLLVLSFALSSCEKKEIKIGFSGCLTGRLSDIGIAGRDGVILAVAQQNEKGGLDGRKIRLIVKDDKQEASTAVEIDQELINANVRAIIGHMTSSMSKAVLDLVNKNEMVLLSPTSTSNELTGIDDYFIRTALPDYIQISQTAQLAVKKLNLKSVGILFDSSNKAFTEGWRSTFVHFFQQLGGVVVHQETFTSGQDVNYSTLADKFVLSKAEGIVIIAGALDTALFSQHIRRKGSKMVILTSGWAKTPELIKHGGKSVEGIILPQTHDPQNKNPKYLEFLKDFKKKFGYEANYAATGAYDAANLLFSAINKMDDGDYGNLKDAILSLNKFSGTQGIIEIDKFGDANRDTFIISVQNQAFVTLEI